MPRISRNASINLSIAFTVLFMFVIIVAAFIMPTLANMLIDTPDNIGTRNEISAGGRTFVVFLAYTILADCAVIDILLFLLLRRVKCGLVFTDMSVALIRYISWGAICFGILFAILGGWFQLAYGLAFAGLFLGITLRVVKNVIEEATQIKGENDLTV